jgi:hypothetical protein
MLDTFEIKPIRSQFLFALITLSLMMIRVIEIRTIKVEKA